KWREAEDEKNQRNRADALRQGAERARDEANQARAAAEKSREADLLRVANGTHLLEGDLFGALPWLTEALALYQGDRSREERHRTRIAAVLAQTPRLVHLWLHEQEVEYATFSADGRRIVTASRDCTARVWDVSTGEAITPPLRHGHFVWKAAFS